MATTGEQLPCDADVICMVCKNKPPETETLNCRTCASLWHVPCLPEVPTTILDWECPDCSTPLVNDNTFADAVSAPASATAPSVAGDLISAIRATENDASLTDVEKAKKCQELFGGSSKASDDEMKNRC
ncbi:E3 ubiquitin-protein ligase orthrus 2-like protein, partial [Trifolium pratense]